MQHDAPTPNTPSSDAPVINNFTRGKLKFSRKHIAIVVVIFALLGGFLLWRSFALTPVVASIEAEKMSYPTGTTISKDKNSSSGQALRFASNGKATATITLPSTATSVTLRAASSKCGNQWAGVTMRLDGKTAVQVKSVATAVWKDYTASVNLAKGSYRLEIEAANTAKQRRCARVIFADLVTFRGEAVSNPVPTINFSASPNPVTTGSASTLKWETTNATSCTASGAWSGTKTVSGSTTTGALNATSKYALSCTGPGGNSAAEVTVMVNPPSTPPTSGGSAKGWNGFGPGNWPDANWRPYSAASPFNQPISNPVIHPQSSAIVATALSKGIGNLTTGIAPEKDYAHPIYYAQSTDPLLTISAGSYGLTGTKIHVPANAKAAGGGDGHIAIVQPDGMEYDFWKASISGSTLKASTAYRQKYDGPGIVTAGMIKTDKETGGTTAPYFGQHAGLIRASELAAGKINHALFLVIECGSSDTSFGYGVKAPGSSGRGGSGSFVYPAFKGDAACSGTRAPMGSRFWLQMTHAQIDATGAPAWERTIAKAMSEYGGYMGDTGGPGFAFMFESATMYTSVGYPNPFEPIALAAGLKKDPTWGYTFKPSGKIPWSQYMRVVTPPTPQIP